jgi:GT2 family glycosyltransferase
METLAPDLSVPSAAALPGWLDLTLVSRRPARLPEVTCRAALALPVPVAVRPPHGSPAASIVVVTYNNLAFTKLCLASVLGNTDEPNFELIVVDNASSDGTIDYLREVAAANPHVRVVANATNRGFAPANNQALAVARGDVLVLLNNDTVVPPGWLATLARHLDDPAVGLVGPVTNRIGNEAEVETTYVTYDEMIAFARGRGAGRLDAIFDLPTPCMFCVAMRRDTFARVGPLDERFAVGLLEDDDYARGVRAAGRRTVCADDVFVHHFGQATFGGLVPTGEYGRLLAANGRRFAEKWGEPWQPYGRRPGPRYARLVGVLADMVRRVVPPGEPVVVFSRGDEDLVRQIAAGGARPTLHFPHDFATGGYAGHYPADGAEAVAALRALRRAAGARYVAVPAPQRWWLEHYHALRADLEANSELILAEPGLLTLFGPRRPRPGGEAP